MLHSSIQKTSGLINQFRRCVAVDLEDEVATIEGLASEVRAVVWTKGDRFLKVAPDKMRAELLIASLARDVVG